MIEIRYVQMNDREFWYSLDQHLPEQEFNNKEKAMVKNLWSIGKMI